MKATYKMRLAQEFCNAIREIASKPNNMDNLELYLASHFEEWLEKFANTPEGIVSELKEFAHMDI